MLKCLVNSDAALIKYMLPKIIPGGSHSDSRGTLTFNNDFDASMIKRMYSIENSDMNFIRGWQGHKIEQRWFSAIIGSFKIMVLSLDYFEKGQQELKPLNFELKVGSMDVLHIPPGYLSSIQCSEVNSKLLVLADHHVGEINDELRFEIDATHKEF